MTCIENRQKDSNLLSESTKKGAQPADKPTLRRGVLHQSSTPLLRNTWKSAAVTIIVSNVPIIMTLRTFTN